MTAVALSRPARVLRIEIRRSVVPWSIPLLLALFFFDSYRTAAGFLPVWTVRASVITSHMLLDFSPFAAGLGAWAGSREGRRNIGDLLGTTARPAWARQAAALAGTLFWLVLTFLAGVAVIYVDTARQATWGGPPIWPVTVGMAGVITATVTGFTLGALFPGRFTAPLAAVGAVLLIFIAFNAEMNVTPASSTYALLSPVTAVPPGDIGVFYHVAPDVAIAQVMFMGGITVALLGVLVLAPVLRAVRRGFFAAIGRAGRVLCAGGVALLAAGVAASVTAFTLTGTAKPGVSGWDIPALHDAASDQPVSYTPDCAGAAFPVCVHPAFGAFLPAAAAALQPVAAELEGLPDAPIRAQLVPDSNGARNEQGVLFAGMTRPGVSGTPPVYYYNSDNGLAPLWGSPAGADNAGWRAGFQQEFLTAFLANPASFAPTPAQQAVVTTLMAAAGSPAPVFGQADNSSGQPIGPSPAQIAAVAARFQALSPAARHAWLATHMPALRAGHITLAQLP